MADKAKIREEVKALTEQLEAGIQDLYSSDKYLAYLNTMSNFHSYSFRNTMLIHLQRPGATYVAGFKKWKNEFERHVMKDEKSIRILAPSPFIAKKEMQKIDPDTGARLLDEDGMPVMEEVEVKIPAFTPVSVFDISQTDGKPLPSLAEDLTGDVRQYEAFMDALKAVSAMPIGFEALDPDTDGECRYDSRQIAIREGMSEIQTVSAALHEMTHAELHDYNEELDRQESGQDEVPAQDEENPAPKPKKRRAEEIEAESVSYVVCQHYGIDTAANSFGYIAGWSKGKELAELRESLELIRSSAASMISRIDEKFAEICKERGIDLTPEQDAPERASDAPAQEAAEQPAPEAAAPAKRKYYITPRQQEQAERMAEKWDARAEAFYAGGDGWGQDTADYCKTPEDAERATDRAQKIRDAISSLLSGGGKWADVQIIRDAVSGRDELDAQVAARQDEKNHAAPDADTPQTQPSDRGPQPWDAPDASPMWKAHGIIDEIEKNGTRYGPNERNMIVNYALHTEDMDKVRQLAGDLAEAQFEKTHGYANLSVVERVKKEIDALEAATVTPDPVQREADKFIEDIGGIGNLFGKPTPPPKSAQHHEKQYELGYGHMGNGLTVWNRLEEKNGDYVTVAHIGPDRNVKYYEKDLPESVKAQIEHEARTSNMRISATQDAPVFHTPPQLDLIDQFAADYYSCSVDTYRNGNVRDNPQTVNTDMAGIAKTVRDGNYDAIRENLARMAHNSKNPEQPLTLMERLDQIQAAELNAGDVLPDLHIGLSARNLYGYKDPSMLPLLALRALELYDADHTIYMLNPDGSEEMVFDRSDIEAHDGIFGIDAGEWQSSREFEAMKAQTQSSEATKEARLIYGKDDSFGIYQLKGGDELRNYRFESLATIEDRGLSVDRDNYSLIYTTPLTGSETLGSIYEKFNQSHPADFQGHSLSMSDIVVLKQDGEITSHYVDSFDFTQLPSFTGHEKQPELASSEVERRENDQVADISVSTPPAPTVDELEAQANAGQQISLTDLMNAVKNERQNPAPGNRPPAQNTRSKSDKPSILAQLREAQQEAAQGKDQGKDAPKRDSEREV